MSKSSARFIDQLLPALNTSHATTIRDERIGKELETILASESFKGSKRCQAFLKYVVEATASGSAELLKERTLGVDVFGRDPAYDTGDDAIVRVKANEVRKRLAQYSLAADPAREVRIELPPGSYIPHFEFHAEEAQPAGVKRWTPTWVAAGSLFMLLVCFGIAYAVTISKNPIKLFWGPVTGSANAPIICLGHPDLYIAVNGEPPLSTDGHIDASGVSTTKRDVPALSAVLVRDRYVGVGDSDAGFLIGRTLQSLGRTSQARLGSDVTFSDLKKAPAVLVGAFSNRWTMSMTKGLRFTFYQVSDDKRVIVDHAKPSAFWEVPSLSKVGEATEDYALVSRLLTSPTGQPLISVAGISNYGSQAAGEFVTDPTSLKKLEGSLPKDWERMNLQIVLKTKVVGETPTPAEVVATYYWK